jgi:hypothetical protein
MPHQPDEAVAKDSGGGFAPHSEGQFAMLCVDVVNLGTNVEQYQDKPPREVAKVALVFASGERQAKEADKDESLALVTVEMALSASEKANLRKLLESWRGRPYTPEQVEAGLPVNKLYSQPALISIAHVLTKKNKKFAKIASIAPLPKAMLVAVDAKLLTEYQRPAFFGDRKKQYAEALAKHRAANGNAPPPPAEPNGEEEDDDLPF